MGENTLYNAREEARVATEGASLEVSEEARTRRGPWVIAIVVLISVVLFTLISNPIFAAWLSGTNS